MSNTPRTDEACSKYGRHSSQWIAFGRELEGELAASKVEAAKAVDELNVYLGHAGTICTFDKCVEARRGLAAAKAEIARKTTEGSKQ